MSSEIVVKTNRHFPDSVNKCWQLLFGYASIVPCLWSHFDVRTCCLHDACCCGALLGCSLLHRVVPQCQTHHLPKPPFNDLRKGGRSLDRPRREQAQVERVEGKQKATQEVKGPRDSDEAHNRRCCECSRPLEHTQVWQWSCFLHRPEVGRPRPKVSRDIQ